MFPGLEEGERAHPAHGGPGARLDPLGRTARCWPRAAAARAARRSAEVGSSIAGTVAESDDAAERRALFARGFAGDTPVGTTGLERALQRQAGGHARRHAARGRPDPGAQRARDGEGGALHDRHAASRQAAVTALAGRLGGIAALDTRNGEVRALAGIAFSAPQPPGSMFKIVTTAAALEEKKVKLSDEFPVESRALIDGVTLENANGELCGGTFAESFAHSCNSVFAPLGREGGRQEAGRDRRALRLERQAATSRARRRARSPTPARSSPRWRSARRRSASSRCWPPRSRWRPWPRPSANDGVRLAPTLEPAPRPSPSACSRRRSPRRSRT